MCFTTSRSCLFLFQRELLSRKTNFFVRSSTQINGIPGPFLCLYLFINRIRGKPYKLEAVLFGYGVILLELYEKQNFRQQFIPPAIGDPLLDRFTDLFAGTIMNGIFSMERMHHIGNVLIIRKSFSIVFADFPGNLFFLPVIFGQLQRQRQQGIRGTVPPGSCVGGFNNLNILHLYCYMRNSPRTAVLHRGKIKAAPIAVCCVLWPLVQLFCF